LCLPKDESDEAFEELEQQIERLMHPALSTKDLPEITSKATFPTPFKNLLLILAAETARRRKWLIEAEDLINMCSNPVLQYAWNSWRSRLTAASVLSEDQGNED
jgi:hypothetical protein